MVTWLLLAVLTGCGTSMPERDPVGAALAEPWGELALPVGGGEVAEISADSLHVAYRGLDTSEIPGIATRYTRALEREGWTVEEPRNQMGFLLIDARRDGRNLSLMVSGMGKRVDVLLEAG